MSRRILMVIAPKDFRDEEFFEPYRIFTREQGWSAIVASTEVGTAHGMLGGTQMVDTRIADQKADDYDALVVVGGMGSPQYLWHDEPLLQLVRDFESAGKVVGAICLSGAVLAKAGILAGRNATVWEAPESIAEFEKGNARYIKQDVVVDGHIVTSNGPHAASAFGQELVDQLTRVPA